jgi:hypothetical protein
MLAKALLAGMIAALAAAPAAFCADVSGSVSDFNGFPVANVRVSATDNAGHSGGSALTDEHGKYRLAGMAPETYTFVLDPLASGFKGGNGLAHLGEHGLIIDWKISRTTNALAVAREDTGEEIAGDPFGFTMGEFAGLVGGAAGVISSGVIGGVAAAGGFSGSSSSASR